MPSEQRISCHPSRNEVESGDLCINRHRQRPLIFRFAKFWGDSFVFAVGNRLTLSYQLIQLRQQDNTILVAA